MIPGGQAGKLGNRYEAKWLVRCLMDIIADKADWLKFEGVETEYQGFEFAIGRGDITEWHQTKINSPGGNWTINALKKRQVLKAFSNRLLTDENAHCFFVSQDNAKELRDLIEKAKTANSINKYIQILSKKQNDDFQKLKNEWQQPDEVMFDLLNRSHIEIIPERELDSSNESHGDLYFQDGRKCAFSNLRDILEKNFNKTLSVKSVRDIIKLEGGLKFKEWAFDPNLQQRLDEETNAYLQTYTPFGVGGKTILRDQSKTIVDEILKPDGPELLLLTGVAGSGKSGVVRSIIEKLREIGVPHLAFRVDQYLSCGTREALGKKLTGREESPVSTLKGTYPATSSILFIDQVDAVSEISGRNGQVKEVIFRLITDAHNFGGVRIIVVCRTFDLDSDPRLKRLKEDNRTKQIDVPMLDWKADVESLLKNKGYNSSSFNEPQRQLLCLPINLAVFLEIDDPTFSFTSLSNLHEKLIEKKQRIIANERKPSWSLLQPLTAMCDWMSERQILSAPISILDTFPNAVEILTSEGLIITSRGQVNFFHESFFDHIYARSFVTKNITLIDLLTSTEQHLFRRTQARQILEALRQNDYQRYLSELSEVLSSDKIRFHIKAAICQWLSTIDNPSEQEFKIISQFDISHNKFHQFFRSAVLSTHAWFNLLYESNWIRQQIGNDNKDRVEMVLWWLSNIAGGKPIEIAKLLREWWGENAERAERLINWFGFVKSKISNSDMHQLCIDLINSNPKSLFQDQKNRHIEMLLHTYGRSPEYCGVILHALYGAWFKVHLNTNPFNRDELKAIDVYYLNEIAKKSPQAFLQGTTDALLRSINMVVNGGKMGHDWYAFSHRTYTGHRFGFDEFLGIYRAALIDVAQNSPEIAANFLGQMDAYKHECLMHLHLEVIHSNPIMFGHELPVLLSNKSAFCSGWDGAHWLSLANACRSAFPHLSLEKKEVVEKAILDHTPEIDFGIRVLREINQKGEIESFWTKKSVIGDLNHSGYEQWCILETIGEALLSAVSLSHLYELRRKFPKAKIEEPTHMEAHFVGSPIKRVHCDKMNDNQWLSAIEHYDNDKDRRRGRNFVDGGASQLATELQQATKKDSVRFSALILKISDTAHKAYIENILWGLAETENPTDESLIKAVKRAHLHSDKPFGSNIARILEKHPHIAANAEILEILIWYALNGEANESEESDKEKTERETITINTLIQRGSSLHIAGINGARGWAWEALGSVLWKVPEAENSVWKAIHIALKKETLISVRCCIMKALSPLFNKNKDRFSESIKQLIVLPDGVPQQHDASRLAPLVTHTGVHLFPYIYNWLPELANELTAELLECTDQTKQLIGAWLIFCESFRNTSHIEQADILTAVSVDHRRLMADVASETITWAEDRHRAEHLLTKFFFDEDEQVRKHAADTFRQIKANEVESYRDLAAEFLKSPAFRDSSFAVLDMLETATCNVLDLIIEAAQQIIKAIEEKGDQYGKHGADFHQLKDVLKREYASSESDVEARKKILDIVDLMLAREIYGVDSIVTTHD